MSWTINENTRVSSTQYFNASYSTTLVANNGFNTSSVTQNVAGYTSGTISFTLDSDPDSWGGTKNLEMRIIGGVDIKNFFVNTLVLDPTSQNTIFYVDWNIPLETVALNINNISTGGTRTVSNIRMQTESEGGALGFVSTSGAVIGPGGSNTQIQFNDGGIFGGASGALYDKTNTQIKLANGTAALPILAFSDGTHPAGTYDTGIYRAGVNIIGVSCASNPTVGIFGAPSGTNFIEGLNIGVDSTGPGGTNICAIRRISSTATNSWEDGHLGNNNYVFFTPWDFVGDVSSTRNYQYGSSSQVGPIVLFTTSGISLTGVKLMPKGFRVKETDDGREFELYSASAGGFVLRVFLNEQRIGGNPSFTNLEASGGVSWTSGASDNLVTNGSGTVSDGTLQNLYYITSNCADSTSEWSYWCSSSY